MCGPREAAVGEQGDVLAQALADQSGGDGEHLAHTRAAGRSLVADHDDVPALDAVGGDRRHRVLLGLEHTRGAHLLQALVAGELDHAAFGREVPAQDREPAGGLDRVGQRSYDGLAVRLLRTSSDLADAAAGDGRRVAVEQAGFEQALGHERDPPGLVEIHGHVVAPRLEAAQQRRALADGVEVVDRQLDAGLARDGEQVQHRVR